MADFDVVIVGSGPGGYVAAIKAAQHGKTVAIIERESLGGICLNWGCIPTKALLKSAEMFHEFQHAKDFGLSAADIKADFPAVIKRSRDVAAVNSKGVEFLMKKNKVTVIPGTARFIAKDTLEVVAKDGASRKLTAKAFIVATGGRPRQFPHLPVDGKNVINYREAMSLPVQPKSLLCIGAGAIGMEFGYFYAALGTQVQVVEVLDQVLPVEDKDVAVLVAKSFDKMGIKIHLSTKVAKLEITDGAVKVHLDKAGQVEVITVEKVLVSVGIVPNTENLGLDLAGVKLDERGFIAIDENCQTSNPAVYAIGDVAGKQLLAHKASFEGEAAVGHITGHPVPVNYNQIPGCTYCQPQVASIGLTEQKAKALGRPLKIGKFNFMASGKARAISHPEGFVKLIFDAEYDQLIGAHLVGVDTTELLAELSLAMKLECTAREIMLTIHAHPTLSEAVMEAAADALGECVHQ